MSKLNKKDLILNVSFIVVMSVCLLIGVTSFINKSVNYSKLISNENVITLKNSGDVLIYNNLIDNSTIQGLINKTEEKYLKNLSGILFLNVSGEYRVNCPYNYLNITINTNATGGNIGEFVSQRDNLDKPYIIVFKVKNCVSIYCSLEFIYWHEIGHLDFNLLNKTEKIRFVDNFNENHKFIRHYSNNSYSEYYADNFALDKLGLEVK